VHFGDWGRKRHLRLFRRMGARFSDVSVHEGVICRPPYGTLDGIMIHDTVTSEEEAIEKNRLYAELGARELRARGRGGLSSAVLHSTWALLRGFLLKGGFLDGAIGWKVAWTIAKRTWQRYRLVGQRPRVGHETSATARLWKSAFGRTVKAALVAARNEMRLTVAGTFPNFDLSGAGSMAASLVKIALVVALISALVDSLT
jgi:hypothetical protein